MMDLVEQIVKSQTNVLTKIAELYAIMMGNLGVQSVIAIAHA